MQSYFKHISKQISDNISTANDSLKIAVAWFTNDSLFDNLLELLQRQVKIDLIVVNDSINNRATGLDFNRFIELGGHFYFANSASLMHHKLAIIDGKKLISGSYNWTYKAEYRNSENIIITNDNLLVENFLKEFKQLKETATKQVDKVTLTPGQETEINVREYIKSDLVFKSLTYQRKGELKKSKEILEKAKKIASDNNELELKIQQIEESNEKPEYHYHVEDGQFSFDYYDSKLLGKEGEVIKVDMWGNGNKEDDIYILFIDGFYVECIGSIERSFPKSKEEHEEIKKYEMDLHADD
ncbi:MAG: DUF1669 domain-containing protein [Chitinophagaceae bacterium]|nr:DUF1669 domain-containing protein [Chitinophagaceae bacterium]